MRHVPRIYIPDSAMIAGASLILDKEVRHRLVNVSRVRENQEIILFNGQDNCEARAMISEISRKQIFTQILSVKDTQRESNLQTRLCQALEKSDRMDYSIQKSVELGVTEIQPMLTAHSLDAFKDQRLEKKMAHWQGVIIHACEQSGRCVLPELKKPVRFSDLIKSGNKTATRLIPDPDADTVLNKVAINTEATIDLFIGPIGGYAREEISEATEQGLESIRLGPRILRTESAGPALLAILQSLHGDWS